MAVMPSLFGMMSLLLAVMVAFQDTKVLLVVLLLRPAFQAVVSFWNLAFRPPTSFRHFKGDWAVITGASRGLGRGLALGLARRGLNVVLIARNQDALLQAVAAQCRKFGVCAVAVQADVSEESQWSTIQSALDSLSGDISVLVNNVGGRPPPSLPTGPNPSVAEFVDAESHDSYFKFNVVPAVRLTNMLLEGMVSRDRGYILNVASINALMPCPLLVAYSASKAYVVAWSSAISTELKGRGSKVRVDVVCPGPVATDGIGMQGKGNHKIPCPDLFAERTLSLATTREVTIPYLPHRWLLQMYSARSRIVPECLAEKWLFQAMMPSW